MFVGDFIEESFPTVGFETNADHGCGKGEENKGIGGGYSGKGFFNLLGMNGENEYNEDEEANANQAAFCDGGECCHFLTGFRYDF